LPAGTRFAARAFSGLGGALARAFSGLGGALARAFAGFLAAAFAIVTTQFWRWT
jgi:hypothetical protein